MQSFSGAAGKQQVSTEGGSQPRWRRNGKELFYRAPDNKLMMVSIAPASDGHTVVAGAPVTLFKIRIAGSDQPKQQYAVAADGERFLMNVVADETNFPPITIVQNWQSALGARERR